MKQELNLLIVFDTVMKSGAINKAAEILKVSPPAVSQSLRKLKEIHNDPLFFREGNKLKPTIYAESLHENIKTPLEELLLSSKRVESFDPKKTSVFTIATTPDTELFFFDKLINYIEKNELGLSVNLVLNKNEEDLKTLLRLRQVDMVIGLTRIDDLSYENKIVTKENMIAISKKNHPRLKDELTIEDLKNEKHVVWHRAKDDKSFLSKYHQFNQSYVYQGSLMNMAYMCLRTNCISVFPETLYNNISEHNDSFKKYKLPFDIAPVPFYMITHNAYKKNQSLQWLKDTITKLLKDEKTVK